VTGSMKKRDKKDWGQHGGEKFIRMGGRKESSLWMERKEVSEGLKKR